MKVAKTVVKWNPSTTKKGKKIIAPLIWFSTFSLMLTKNITANIAKKYPNTRKGNLRSVLFSGSHSPGRRYRKRANIDRSTTSRGIIMRNRYPLYVAG